MRHKANSYVQSKGQTELIRFERHANGKEVPVYRKYPRAKSMKLKKMEVK